MRRTRLGLLLIPALWAGCSPAEPRHQPAQLAAPGFEPLPVAPGVTPPAPAVEAPRR